MPREPGKKLVSGDLRPLVPSGFAKPCGELCSLEDRRSPGGSE